MHGDVSRLNTTVRVSTFPICVEGQGLECDDKLSDRGIVTDFGIVILFQCIEFGGGPRGFKEVVKVHHYINCR